MRTRIRALANDDSGTSMVEFSIVASMFLVVTFGLVEFSFALWQWNSASKATQLGARIAAVSDSVWQELKSETVTGTVGGATVSFDVECDGSTGTCTGDDASAGRTYDAAALSVIVRGRDSACGSLGADAYPGMCDIFERITDENVIVRYYYSGLGFPGRPGGPVPTITVRLTGLQFEFVALSALLGFAALEMPDFVVSMTGEDLCVSSPSSC